MGVVQSLMFSHLPFFLAGDTGIAIPGARRRRIDHYPLDESIALAIPDPIFFEAGLHNSKVVHLKLESHIHTCSEPRTSSPEVCPILAAPPFRCTLASMRGAQCWSLSAELRLRWRCSKLAARAPSLQSLCAAHVRLNNLTELAVS